MNIGGEKIRFIVDVSADRDSLAYDHFKELGRWIGVELKEDKVRKEIVRRVVDDGLVRGERAVQALFVRVFRRSACVLAVSGARPVPQFCGRAGHARGAVSEALGRLVSWSRPWLSVPFAEGLGLQLTSFTFSYKHLQLVRCSLLKHSSDPVVSGAYALKSEREAAQGRVWSAARELEALGPLLEHEQRFGGQGDRKGLGAGRYLATPTARERRARLVGVLLGRWSHAGLERQGAWTHWDGVRPFDLSWRNLLNGPGPRLLGFVLNSLINSVRTPDMLHLWGYAATSDCPLCMGKKCTLHHILVNCSVALKQGRYNWRHDSVLLAISEGLEGLLQRRKISGASSRSAALVTSFRTSFVRAGAPSRPASKVPDRCLLEGPDGRWSRTTGRPVVFPPWSTRPTKGLTSCCGPNRSAVSCCWS